MIHFIIGFVYTIESIYYINIYYLKGSTFATIENYLEICDD